MTPQISISQSLFDKIKGLAEPFVDTPESVITRCVDFYTNNHGSADTPSAKPPLGAESPMPYPGDAAPDLTFSRPISIKLDGKMYEKRDLYWNSLLYDVIGIASAKLKSKEKLKQIILVNYVEGQGSQKQGYHFLPEIGLSVQGQDANAAWKAAFHIIKATQLNIDVLFMWQNNDKAARPGKTGRMTYESV
jgi:hypothetical protein